MSEQTIPEFDKVAVLERVNAFLEKYPEQVLRMLDGLERHHGDKSANIDFSSWFRYPVGHSLKVELEVVDTDLAQLLLASAFGGPKLIPGMEIQSIVFSDKERDDVIREYLQNQLNQLS